MAAANIEEYLKNTEYQTRRHYETFIKISSLQADEKIIDDMAKWYVSKHKEALEAKAQAIQDDDQLLYEEAVKAEKILYGKIIEKMNQAQDNANWLNNPYATDFKKGMIQDIAFDILKLAHGGIKAVYGSPDHCRRTLNRVTGNKSTALTSIYDTTLSLANRVDMIDLIWQGRNQAEHHDQPHKFNDELKRVFNKLETEDPANFRNYNRKENKAYEIIQLLNWLTYEQYEAGMLTLK